MEEAVFPKDVKALIRTGDEYNRSLEILKAVELVNENQKAGDPCQSKGPFRRSISKEKNSVSGDLSFKPHTDDMREAPSSEDH